MGAPDRAARVRRGRPAGDSRPRHGPRRRRAGRGRRPPYAARVRGLPHRISARSPPEEWAIWPHLERAHGRITSGERHLRPRPAARASRAHGLDRRGFARRSTDRRWSRRRWRIATARRRTASNCFGASSAASPATWRSPSSLSAASLWRAACCRACSISSTRSTFRQAFEDKAPVDALARRIPTRLVTHADSVLVGMAAIAAAPTNYAHRLCRARLDLRRRGAAFSPLSCGGVWRENGSSR